jgi:hypothetical protein
MEASNRRDDDGRTLTKELFMSLMIESLEGRQMFSASLATTTDATPMTDATVTVVADGSVTTATTSSRSGYSTIKITKEWDRNTPQ